MVCRDPALVVSLSTAGDGRAISTNNADLVGGVDLLGTTRGALGALTTLAAAALLREESGDPGVVDEVAGTAKDGGENEVEEDAARGISWCRGKQNVIGDERSEHTSEGQRWR